MPKKNYFAQNSYNDNRHRSKGFWTLEEAEEWLKNNGGGTVKERNAAVVYDCFCGFIRGWGEVSHIPPTEEN